MVNFHDYEYVLLEDIAEWERAKPGHIYPKGSSTIQISASRGQVGFLEEAGTVPSKDVVVIPASGINKRYFNIILQKNMDKFLSRYATGINIQEHEVGNFPIELHKPDTQDAIAKIMARVDSRIDETEREIGMFMDLKKDMLQQMFV